MAVPRCLRGLLVPIRDFYWFEDEGDVMISDALVLSFWPVVVMNFTTIPGELVVVKTVKVPFVDSHARLDALLHCGLFTLSFFFLTFDVFS